MENEINVADLIAAYGAYFDGTNRQATLFSRVYRGIKEIAEGVIVLIPQNATRWESSDSEIGDVLQAFQKDYTPAGDLDFLPHLVNLFNVKSDIRLCPDKIKDNWAGFLANGNLDRSTWPFVRWIVEEHIIPKLIENIGVDALYKAQYVAPTAGTAGTPVQSMDGLEKVQDDLVASTAIAPIALGAAPTDPQDFVTYVEDFMDAVDERFNNLIRHVSMSEAFARRYSRGYQLKYAGGVRLPGDSLYSEIANYEARVFGSPAMAGKTRLWASTPNNTIMVAKNWDNHMQFRVAPDDNPRFVKLYTDFWAAPNYAKVSEVFITDQV